MLDARLSNLSVLSIDSVRANTLDLERIIDMFISKYPNCCIYNCLCKVLCKVDDISCTYYLTYPVTFSAV